MGTTHASGNLHSSWVAKQWTEPAPCPKCCEGETACVGGKGAEGGWWCMEMSREEPPWEGVLSGSERASQAWREGRDPKAGVVSGRAAQTPGLPECTLQAFNHCTILAT